MSFASPDFLPWLVLVVVLAWLLWLYRTWQQRALQTWASHRFLQQWRVLWPAWRQHAGDVCLCLGLLCLLLALARPRWGWTTQKAQQRGLDLVVILDVSPSMMLQDLQPTRWHQAVFAIQALTQQLQGDRMALVAFHEDAGLQAPFTDDITALKELTWHTRPGLLAGSGQGLASALRLAQQLLQPRRQEHDDRLILAYTDGDPQHTSAAIEMARILQQQRIHLVIVGVGNHRPPASPSSSSSQALVNPPLTNSRSVLRSDWTPVDTRSLQQIAASARGHFWPMNASHHDHSAILDTLRNLRRSERQQQTRQQPKDRYLIAIALALFFLTLHRLLLP